MSDVIIIGAGMGGLSAGMALARAGLDVAVLESRRGPLTDHWGYTLWPPGTRTLDWLGVLEQVVSCGSRLKALRWLNGNGSEWMSVNLESLNDLGQFIGILPSKLDAILRRESVRSGLRIIEGIEHWSYERTRSGSFKVKIVVAGEECSLSTRFIVGADGPDSLLRQRLGVKSWKWRPPGQVILTGIGGPLAFEESRQAMGIGWSGGAVAVGRGQSWLYAIVNEADSQLPREQINAYGRLDAQAQEALAKLDSVVAIRPWSRRVRHWVANGILLMGDAAHCILPHLGLGGTMALEDVPLLSEVITDALRKGETKATALRAFHQHRRARVAYARRISEFWALSMTSRLPGLRFMRDYKFNRLSKCPELVETFVRELSGSEPPTIRTRVGMWLP